MDNEIPDLFQSVPKCIDCEYQKTSRQLSDEKFRHKMSYHFRCLAAVVKKGHRTSKLVTLLKAQEAIQNLEEKLKVLMTEKGYPGEICYAIWSNKFQQIIDKDRRNYIKDYSCLLESIQNVVHIDDDDDLPDVQQINTSVKQNSGVSNIDDNTAVNPEFINNPIVMHFEVITNNEDPDAYITFPLDVLELEKTSHLMETPKKRQYIKTICQTDAGVHKKTKLKNSKKNLRQFILSNEKKEKPVSIKRKRREIKKQKVPKILANRSKSKISLQFLEPLPKKPYLYKSRKLKEKFIKEEEQEEDTAQKQDYQTSKSVYTSTRLKVKHASNEFEVPLVKKRKMRRVPKKCKPNRKYRTRSSSIMCVDDNDDDAEIKDNLLLQISHPIPDENENLNSPASELRDGSVSPVSCLENNMIDVQDSELAIETLNNLCERWSDTFIISPPSMHFSPSVSPLDVQKEIDRDIPLASTIHCANMATPRKKSKRSSARKCCKKLDYNKLEGECINGTNVTPQKILDKENIICKREYVTCENYDIKQPLREWNNGNSIGSKPTTYSLFDTSSIVKQENSDGLWNVNIDFNSSPFSQSSVSKIITDIMDSESSIIDIKEIDVDNTEMYTQLFSLDEQELHMNGVISPLNDDDSPKKSSSGNQCVPDSDNILDELSIFGETP